MCSLSKTKKIIELTQPTIDALKLVAKENGRSTKNLIEFILDEHAAVARGEKRRIAYKREGLIYGTRR